MKSNMLAQVFKEQMQDEVVDEPILVDNNFVEIPDEQIDINIELGESIVEDNLRQNQELIEITSVVKDLATHLNKMSSRGVKEEDLQVVGDVINRLTDSDEESPVLSNISNEGFLETVVNIWKKIRDFFVSLAKSIWNFILELFNLNKKTDTANKESAKKADDIKKNNMKFNEEFSKEINSPLVYLMNNEIDGRDSSEVSKEIIGMYERYNCFFNMQYTATMKYISDNLINTINELTGALSATNITGNTVNDVYVKFEKLISYVVGLNQLFVGNSLQFKDLPGDVINKLIKDSSKDKRQYTYMSLMSVDKPQLCRNYNIFSSFQNVTPSIEILHNNFSNLSDLFNVTSFKDMNNLNRDESTALSIEIQPIQELLAEVENNRKNIKVDKVTDSFQKLSRDIQTCIDTIAKRSATDISRLSDVLQVNTPVEMKIKRFIKHVQVHKDDYDNIVDTIKNTRLKDNVFYARIYDSKFLVEILRDSQHQKYKKSAYYKFLLTTNESIVNEFMDWVEQDLGIDFMSGFYEANLITKEIKDKYRNLDRKVDELLKTTFSNLNVLLSAITTDSVATYVEFDTNVSNYISTNLSRFNQQ